MSNRRHSEFESRKAWRSVAELLILVVLLSILPYADREIARSLGGWTLIAPALALSLAFFGGWLIYVELGHERNFDRQKIPLAALLIALTTGAALNTWAVATSWIEGAPMTAGPRTTSKLKTDLDAVAASPDVERFGKVAGSTGLPSAPSLNVMVPYVKGMLDDVKCTAIEDSKEPAFMGAFECRLRSNTTPEWPACRFIWSLAPIHEGTGATLATAKSRDDVVAKFTRSGYGKFDLSGGPPAAAPYLGVAFIACASGNLPDPPPKGNLRVAFVLANPAQITTYHSIFRTVGFDWVGNDHFVRPYIAELFALTSLYKVSHIIFSDNAKFTQTVTSSDQDDLFGVDEIAALRQMPWGSVRVGNQSDGQLGNSRGSCLLVADVSGLRSGSLRVHVAPSAVTPDLATADRSLVLLPARGEPISLPCTLISALVTRDMSAANNYPAGLTGKTLAYYLVPGESTQDAQRRGYNVRAAGLTLYLLGFGVTFNARKTPPRVVGLWPRAEFVATKKMP